MPVTWLEGIRGMLGVPFLEVDEARNFRHLSQQLDNTIRIPQRYECLFQQLQGDMSRLGSYLRSYDKMRMEIAENRDPPFILLRNK